MTATALESAAFIVSPTQVALDTAMFDCDIWGTQAHVLMLESTGIVEFEARFRADGVAGTLHETSRFVRENGRWLYLAGVVQG